jgi:ABC-2 type transport system permease protein
MRTIIRKELGQFFSSMTGYLSVLLFLLLNGLFLFVFPDTNLFDAGYATLDAFFKTAPWILLMLIPAITMRSFSEEFRAGTWEVLCSRPLTRSGIIGGKYLAALLIVICALLPTLIYVWTVARLSTAGIDGGGIAGSYIGLVALSAVFTAIGIFFSSISANPVIAFLSSVFGCFVFHTAFTALAGLEFLKGGAGYWVEMMGIEAHYRSMSRGVIDSRDVVYFGSVITFFLFLTARKLQNR